MSTQDPKPGDPSMAEILASIRDILNEDDKSPPDEPLELTEAMLVSPPAAPEPVSIDLPPAPGARPAEAARPGGLLDPVSAAATAAALGHLARAVAGDRTAPVTRHGGASIEDVVRDEMRPLLKAWLDQHLPGMVEQIVKAEIGRLMGRDGG